MYSRPKSDCMMFYLTLVICTNEWYIPQHVLYCILVIHYNLNFACFITCFHVIERKFKQMFEMSFHSGCLEFL